MHIRCWGSRGSIPVSGEQFKKYGGDTTCIQITSAGGHTIIVDAGSGIRPLGNKILENGPGNLSILFTHAHWDHIMGLPFFKPIFRKQYSITIFGCPFHLSSYRTVIEGLMSAPYFPVPFNKLCSKIKFINVTTTQFRVGDVTIKPIFLNHPNGGLGYRFEENGSSFVFLTDNELGFYHNGGLKFDDYAEFSEGCDLLIHDAEFTKKEYKSNRSWGHSLFTDTIKLALKAGVKRLGLFHLNQDHTDKDIDSMVEEAKKILKEKKSRIHCFAVDNSFEILLS